ncbi:MAG: MarR family transcriptional regulator [Candidatus Sericytochromatia bacterium]|nr:MarR family transcriptional regulator [Candidatus Sericytochromatia bacterium]
MSPSPEPWTPIPQDVSLLPVLRHLVLAQSQVARMGNRFVETHGLTMPQFDVVATLGDTPGLTCKELSEQSLTTKGSLLPLLDRLEAKAWVRRSKGEKDSRQTIVSLTDAGQALYQAVFPAFVDVMNQKLALLTPEERDELVRLLKKLDEVFR